MDGKSLHIVLSCECVSTRAHGQQHNCILTEPKVCLWRHIFPVHTKGERRTQRCANKYHADSKHKYTHLNTKVTQSAAILPITYIHTLSGLKCMRDWELWGFHFSYGTYQLVDDMDKDQQGRVRWLHTEKGEREKNSVCEEETHIHPTIITEATTIFAVWPCFCVHKT